MSAALALRALQIRHERLLPCRYAALLRRRAFFRLSDYASDATFTALVYFIRCLLRYARY